MNSMSRIALKLDSYSYQKMCGNSTCNRQFIGSIFTQLAATIFTARNSSSGKVMFPQVSVCSGGVGISGTRSLLGRGCYTGGG